MWQAVLDGRFYTLDEEEITRDALACRDELGWGPLHHACRNGDDRTISCLLDAGSQLDEQNNAGQNPLHIAFIYGHVLCGRRLLIRYKKELEKQHKIYAKQYLDEWREHCNAGTKVRKEKEDVEVQKIPSPVTLHSSSSFVAGADADTVLQCDALEGEIISETATEIEEDPLQSMALSLLDHQERMQSYLTTRDDSGRTPLHEIAALIPASDAHDTEIRTVLSFCLHHCGVDLAAYVDAEGRNPLQIGHQAGRGEPMLQAVTQGARTWQRVHAVVHDWGQDEVAGWLKSIRMDSYERLWEEMQLPPALLLCLERDSVQEIFANRIAEERHRQRLLGGLYDLMYS